MTRQSHNSKRLATPVGPFSHACHPSDLVFLPGQIGQHPQTGKLVEGGVTEQARQILENLRSLLEELFLQPDNIIKVNIFLTDMADFAAVNAVYA
jgi:2-iminobutanoate/2-iminopropanoate deaminase